MTRQSARVPDTAPRLRVPAVAVAAALLLGWAAGPGHAQQSPGGWTSERRAVLPSGLTVRLDFAPLPGIGSSAAPGVLGGSGADQPYADGMRSGDPAETFRIGAERADADGSWRELGSLRIGFSRPVRNPRLHVSGLAAHATGASGSTATAARLSLTGATPAAPVLVGRTPWTGWTLDGNTLAPPADLSADTAADGAGTLELTGTVSTVTLRLEQRSTARNGSATPAPALQTAFTVTLDESLGSAPAGYGNASHLLSDLALGRRAAEPSARAGLLGTATARPLVGGPAAPGPDGGATDDGVAGAVDVRPLVESVPRTPGPWAAPSRPRGGPGRGEYQGADPTLSFPTEAAAGRAYGLDVPVSTGPGPAVLAGWVDFDRNGHFDPTERVQAEVPAGAASAHLEWTVPERGAVAGETWARLRIARDAAPLVSSGGFADSGEVLDQHVALAVGSARPEITAPVTGAATADVRPLVTGAGGIPGATVAVVEDGAEHCRDRVGRDGGWSCRPDRPLADGPHVLTPVETTAAGAVLRGEPVRLTVRTVPPTAPVLTLPEFTNDPAPLMTGVGEPGSTVSVAEPPGSGRVAGELCSTGVGADGGWSCLPVESLADGTHRLTATAVDAAGNRTAGRTVPLTVDTVPPAPPVLVSPRDGESVPARPRLTGRAEPATTVTVTGADPAGDRAVLCSAVTAQDGEWGCTAGPDLAVGDRTLRATATDRAGNAAAGTPVTVRVAAAPNPSNSPSPSDSPSPSPSLSASTGAGPASPTAVDPVGPSVAASTVGPGESSAAGGAALARPLALPPRADGPNRPGEAPVAGRWSAALGGLLLAAGAGLLLRRLLGRGPGSRRR